MNLADRVAIWALCVASSVGLALACDNAYNDFPAQSGSAGSPSMMGEAGAGAPDGSATPAAIAFDPHDTLTLDPKEAHELVVQTTPPGSFVVNFALIGSGVADAALDASSVTTDENGVARVTLTAPSAPTTFNVRASVTDSTQARLAVSVSARNYTTLTVLPSYSGKRPISEWTATAAAGVTCASLTGTPPPDGDLAVTAAFGKALAIPQVPVGIALAVTLRAGHYVGGCKDQPALSEADGNQVLVYASDRPLNLKSTQLDVSFGPTDPSAALTKLMSAASGDMITALTAGATSDVTALLDAMQTATDATSRDAFTNSRQAYKWDAALSSAFGSGAATRLRDPVTRWLNAGLTSFYARNTFQGPLSAHGAGVTFTPASVAGIAAATAGLDATVNGTWSADSSDTLLLGLDLEWQPSHLLAALARPASATEFPSSATLTEALSTSVDCGLVGSTLAARGPAPSVAYVGCDATCVANACANAITASWKSASTASGSTTASLSVTGTGAASLADDASISELTGSWVGQLAIDAANATAAGPLTGSAASN